MNSLITRAVIVKYRKLFCLKCIINLFVLLAIILTLFGTVAPSGPGPLLCWGFRLYSDTTLSRTPLDEWSDRRTGLYLTTHNTHNRQAPMPPVGFEPTIAAGERLQTHALERAATGTGLTFTDGMKWILGCCNIEETNWQFSHSLDRASWSLEMFVWAAS